MIVRSTKHIFRKYLTEIEDYDLSSAVAHFLNCFFSIDEISKIQDTNKKKKNLILPSLQSNIISNTSIETIHDDKDKPFLLLTSKSLWNEIVESVKNKFQYDLLQEENQYLLSIVKSYGTLRSICQKVGIQVAAIDYDFSLKSPFKQENILNLYPIIKHINPEVSKFFFS